MSAAASISIFPTMLHHVFRGYRGKQSFGNLTNSISLDGFNRIKTYIDIVNRQLFGGMLAFIVVGVGFCLLVFGVKKNLKDLVVEQRITVEKYFCAIIATVLYFLIVSLSSAYLAERYMMPIYAVLFVLILCLVSDQMKKISAAHYLYGMIFIMTIICVNGLKNVDWSLLYRSSESLLDAAQEHSGTDCLFIYDGGENRGWINPAYYEVSEYRSVTFLKEENLEALISMELASHQELIVTLAGENLEIINRIVDMCPSLDAYEQLGKYAYTASYYLYGK